MEVEQVPRVLVPGGLVCILTKAVPSFVELFKRDFRAVIAQHRKNPFWGDRQIVQKMGMETKLMEW